MPNRQITVRIAPTVWWHHQSIQFPVRCDLEQSKGLPGELSACALVRTTGRGIVVSNGKNRNQRSTRSFDPLTQAAVFGVTKALTSIGRGFICLDSDFRVVHASDLVDKLLRRGVARDLSGHGIEELFGEELFGPEGSLRRALSAGEKREGWRATLSFGGSGPALVSLTAAPLERETPAICDPRIAYIVVMRPAADDEVPDSGGPTFFSGAIASSPAMLRIFRLIENLRHSSATVLITGESGTGKEVVARAIHQHSPRAEGPFVAVNCGALPGELLESELFGHARGSFTGALRDRVGRFELAADGTLFLDEIGDLPLALQVKLLRVLQERVFERVGESKSRTSTARIIAATNVDPRKALAEGRLREDLYYRLRVVPIEIPPLRNRREDIEPLANHLLARAASQRGLVKRLSPQAVRVLLDYHWPGNIRELGNAIEYAVAVSNKETVLPDDLPPEVLNAQVQPTPPTAPPACGPVCRRDGEEIDRERLRVALEVHRWRREETARALGLSRTTLWRIMREHSLLKQNVRG